MTAIEPARVNLDDFNTIPTNGTTGSTSIPVRTAHEIDQLPEPPPEDLFLGPLIVRGARTIIVGDTGHGKTTLAMQLAAAVLTGTETLGHTGTGQGPLLVVDLEQGLRSIKRVLREAGVNNRQDVLYAAIPDGLELDTSEQQRTDLERVIVNHQPAMLLLDPYYKAHRADSNEERAIVDLMRFLDELRAAYGFALILPAHPRKEHPSNAGGGARKLSLADVFGSSAVTRGAELTIAIERVSHGYARLRYLKDRDFDLPVGEFTPLTFSKDSGFRIHEKEVEDEERAEERILAATQDWRTVKEWQALLGIRESTTKHMLERLVANEQLSYMVGPPGRSPKAQCYSTSPVSWAQSGEVGSSQPNSVTAPLLPAPIGSSDDGSSRTGSTTAPTAPEQSIHEPDFWGDDD